MSPEDGAGPLVPPLATAAGCGGFYRWERSVCPSLGLSQPYAGWWGAWPRGPTVTISSLPARVPLPGASRPGPSGLPEPGTRSDPPTDVPRDTPHFAPSVREGTAGSPPYLRARKAARCGGTHTQLRVPVG